MLDYEKEQERIDNLKLRLTEKLKRRYDIEFGSSESLYNHRKQLVEVGHSISIGLHENHPVWFDRYSFVCHAYRSDPFEELFRSKRTYKTFSGYFKAVKKRLYVHKLHIKHNIKLFNSKIEQFKDSESKLLYKKEVEEFEKISLGVKIQEQYEVGKEYEFKMNVLDGVRQSRLSHTPTIFDSAEPHSYNFKSIDNKHTIFHLTTNSIKFNSSMEKFKSSSIIKFRAIVKSISLDGMRIELTFKGMKNIGVNTDETYKELEACI